MTLTHTPVEQIQSIVVQVTHHIDAKRWAELESLFGPEVDTDYTSLLGGAPVRQPGAALVGGWRKSLAKVKTQHLLGPIDVSVHGDSALAQCHVRAIHELSGALGGDSWVVVGHYEFGLTRLAERWSITRMKLEVILQQGNLELLRQVPESLAAASASLRQPG